MSKFLTSLKGRLHSGYSWIFGIAGLMILVAEAIGVIRPGAGDTVSERHWWFQDVGLWFLEAGVYGLLGWCLFWHFPAGRGRDLGWQDIAAVTAGIAIAYVIRHFFRLPNG